MGQQILCSLFHGAGIQQSFHGMLPCKAHIHQLKRERQVFKRSEMQTEETVVEDTVWMEYLWMGGCCFVE